MTTDDFPVFPDGWTGRDETITFGDTCATIIDLADDLPTLEARVAQARADARAWARDTLRSPNLDGSRPASIVDDQGIPMPPINDPTGEHVATMLSRDPTSDRHGRALTTARRAVLEARRALDAARGALIAALATRDEQDAAGDLGLAWCHNCARHEDRDLHREGAVLVEGRSRGGVVMVDTWRVGPDTGDGTPKRARCRACYEWTVEAVEIRAGRVPPPAWWGAAEGAWPLERPRLLVLLSAAAERGDLKRYTRESDVRQALGRSVT